MLLRVIYVNKASERFSTKTLPLRSSPVILSLRYGILVQTGFSGHWYFRRLKLFIYSASSFGYIFFRYSLSLIDLRFSFHVS